MKILFTILTCTLSLFAETYISGSIISNSVITDGNTVEKGSGKVVEKNITPDKPFNKITIDTAANITINNSSKNNISLKTDDNLIDNVLLDIKNNTLFIKTKGSVNPTKGLNITVNSKHLNHLSIDGAADVRVQGYRENSFSLFVDGACNVTFTSGTIQKLSIEADGSYDINLLKLNVKNAYIKAEGSGDIKLQVSDYLDVYLEDTVEVEYSGNPTIKKHIDDVADLTHI
ncbi:MAG: DUF2807 domain-containing protein [Epsilonproteobacteria bacterium]|nr:DUF2807 domain-containing protein [Campylobacterota bacterium]